MAIKTLSSTSQHLVAYSNASSPWIPTNGSNSFIGQIRYNNSNQGLEVFDGSNWLILSGSASVGLTGTAESAISWAIKKMADEEELKKKMDKYPTLQKAYDQFKMIEALVYENEEKEKQ